MMIHTSSGDYEPLGGGLWREVPPLAELRCRELTEAWPIHKTRIRFPPIDMDDEYCGWPEPDEPERVTFDIYRKTRTIRGSVSAADVAAAAGVNGLAALNQTIVGKHPTGEGWTRQSWRSCYYPDKRILYYEFVDQEEGASRGKAEATETETQNGPG